MSVPHKIAIPKRTEREEPERTLRRGSETNRQLLASSRRVKKLSSMTENAHTKKLRLVYSPSAVLIVGLLLGTSLGMMISADGPTGFGTVIEPGSMVEDDDYIIFKDGTTYYAKNGTTGAIQFSDTSISELIESIVTSFSGNGGTIYMSEGVYLFDSHVLLTNGDDNVLIVGDSKRTILTPTGNNDLIVTEWWQTGLGLRDLVFQSDGIKTGRALWLNTTSYVRVENCHFESFAGGAVLMDTSPAVKFENCQFVGNGKSSTQTPAIDMTSWSTYPNTFTEFVSCAFEYNAYEDIHIGEKAMGVRMDGCWFEGYSQTTQFNPSYSHITIDNPSHGIEVMNVWITDCFFYENLGAYAPSCYAIYAHGGAMVWVSNNQFREGNTRTTDSVIKLLGTSSFWVENNVISTIDAHGILATNTLNKGWFVNNDFHLTGTLNYAMYLYASETSFSGNRIYLNEAGTGGGIFVDYGWYNTIERNVIMGDYYCGINIGAGNVNCSVTGNMIMNDPTVPIMVAGENTVVRDNIGYTTDAKGTATITTSTSTTFNHGLATTPTYVSASFSPIGWGNYTWTATTTQITITVSASGTYTVYWYAEV